MQSNVKVHAYEDPYKFYFHEEFEPYRNCTHICATEALTRGVKKRFGIPSVISAKKLTDAFYPGWNLPDVRFVQYSSLSDILRNWENNRYANIVQSFRRNKLDLLITMRNLSEIGLTPKDIRPHAQKMEEVIFCDVWEKMEMVFGPYLESAFHNLGSRDNIVSILELLHVPLINNTVVLHGFYYISPVQHYLFSKFKEHGLDIVFLNLYDDRFPAVFSFLEENFSEKYGWAKREDWHYLKANHGSISIANAFASRFENGLETAFTSSGEVSKKSYDYVIDFIEDMDNSARYISPNSEEIQNRIKEFWPEAYMNDRHFLAYPVGQYLFHLHSIYHEERNEYFLSEKILLETFASGWLKIGNDNAKDFTGDLKNILPYFSDCRKASEWLERIGSLIKVLEETEVMYQKHVLEKEDYLKEVRINPLLRFSYFSVPLDTVKTIRKFMEKLIEDTKWLLNIKERKVSIKTHFRRIQKLMEDSNLKSSLMNDVERILVQQLENMLSRPIDDSQKYHIGDLSEAIRVFLTNGLENRNRELMGSLGVDSERDLNIYSMEDLDGLILDEGTQEIHLCGMDDKHFPTKSYPSPWPISFDLLERLDLPATNMYLFRKKHAKEFSKYLFTPHYVSTKELHYPG